MKTNVKKMASIQTNNLKIDNLLINRGTIHTINIVCPTIKNY
jgi:hypothetical protein